MSLQAYTARMGLRDPDYLDITIAGNARRMKDGEPGGHRGIGAAFAPDIRRFHDWRTRIRIGEPITDEYIAAYMAAYRVHMRVSYRVSRAAWDTLLSWSRVVVVCFCTDAERCHRTVLARDILPKLGAIYCGELPKSGC